LIFAPQRTNYLIIEKWKGRIPAMDTTKTPESKRMGLIKALVYGAAAIALYAWVFSHSKFVMDVISSKTIQGPALAITLVLLASGFYGTAANKFFKHTLEKKLESQLTREE